MKTLKCNMKTLNMKTLKYLMLNILNEVFSEFFFIVESMVILQMQHQSKLGAKQNTPKVE